MTFFVHWLSPNHYRTCQCRWRELMPYNLQNRCFTCIVRHWPPLIFGVNNECTSSNLFSRKWDSQHYHCNHWIVVLEMRLTWNFGAPWLRSFNVTVGCVMSIVLQVNKVKQIIICGLSKLEKDFNWFKHAEVMRFILEELN